MAINLGSTAASLGSALGSGLAQPVESALDLLARKKLSDLEISQGIKQQQAQRKQYAETLKPILGDQISDFLSGLSPKEREVAFQNLGGLMQLGGQQIPQQSGFSQLIQQPMQQQIVPQQGSAFDKLLQLQGAQPTQPSAWGSQHAMPPLQQMQPQPDTNVSQSREQLLQDIFTPESVKRERKKLALKEKQMSQAEKLAAFKETKAERKEISDKARAAKQNLHDLERLEELNKENKLDTPGYYSFLERSGFNIPALMDPSSQEFQKISYNFMRDAKAVFGARISNMEIENFLKTLPSLSQSPAGRSRVIANLKYISRANLAYREALKEIMQENKGVPPMDLSEQIDDRIDSRLNAISKKFKKDLEKPIPPAQHRLATFGQALLGSGLGLPGKILSGAAKIAGNLVG